MAQVIMDEMSMSEQDPRSLKECSLQFRVELIKNQTGKKCNFGTEMVRRMKINRMYCFVKTMWTLVCFECTDINLTALGNQKGADCCSK